MRPAATGCSSGIPANFSTQVIGILVTWVFAFVGSLILLKLVDAVVGLRIHEEDEVAGLDISQHNESAYALGLVGSTGVGSSWGSSGHRPPPDH